MFLKKCQRRKNGKQHTYWSLVESFRTAKGSRHRVVAYLGELKPSEKNGWAKLGQHLQGHEKAKRPERTLFDLPRFAAPRDDEPVLVKLSGIKLERTRDFGDVWLALGLWRMLGLDTLLESLMPAGREQVPWHVMAAILTIARLCEPASELHIEEKWYPRTALDDLLGVPPISVHTTRLYETLDHLLPHKEAIEKHLRTRLGELFELKCDLLLYDVTSTYFEGEAAANPLAKRGYSRDSRGDRPQVCIGLVVTEEGMPLGYEVFAGNRHDSTTVQHIIETMERKYGRSERVWVMDRGMVSEANLKFLQDRGGKYIVGTPKQMLKLFEQHLTEKDWMEAQAGVAVKLVDGPAGCEKFLLARSTDRRAKEQAMHAKFTERLETGLKRMRDSAESGRLKDLAKANEQLGRLKEKNWRASHVFDVSITKLSTPRGKQHIEITYQPNAKFAEWNELSAGCYLLRSNLTDIDAATLWKRYIQLTEAEWAFRIAKDELEIRPIWHHKQDRVLAHILVCFLAYVLWKTLAGWMNAAGLGDAPRTLLAEFAKIKSADVVLPVQTRGTATHESITKSVRLRCVTEADEAQRVLLHRLGLSLPQRLRYWETILTPPPTQM